MKICVISSIFPPYTRGGAETVADTVARAFANNGHDVFVITCAPFQGWRSFAGCWDNAPQPPLSLRGGVGGVIKIFRFTPLNLFSIFNIAKYPALLRVFWHIWDMFNWHTYFVVRRILLEQKPELILTHNLKGLGYTIPFAIKNWKFESSRDLRDRVNREMRLKVGNSKKWFHTVHDMAAFHPTGLKIWGQENSFLQHNPLTTLYGWINKKLFGKPDIVILPSQFLLDEYERAGFFPKSRTVIVRNPILLQPRIPRQAAMFRFLYLGQLEPYKGIKLLLDVWQEFSVAHPDAEIIIAGQGSMKSEVERIAKNFSSVHFVSWVAHEHLGDLFSGVRATILPSLAYENSPTVIGESFIYGVPVLASRIGGIPELINDGVNGFLFTPGDRQSLISAMEKIMGNDWIKLSKNALASAGQFSLENYQKRLNELL